MDLKEKTTILFIGNFYQGEKGHNIGSKIIESIDSKNIETKKIILYRNPVARLLKLNYKLLTESFDIVHLEVYSGRYFKFMLPLVTTILSLRKKKVIFNMQGGSLPEFYSDNKSFVSKYLKKGQVHVCPSKRIISFFKKEMPALEIHYLPSFIDSEIFPYSFKKDLEYKILWVRAFDVTYNPQNAIYALQEVIKVFPEATLTMVGPDRGLLNECKDLVNKFSLQKKVIFEGVVDNRQLYKYFHSHNVYINTTKFESFGFALVEAASCGIPIVSSNVGEIPYIWKDNNDILLYESGDVKGLADKITLVFKDQELRENLSVNARKTAEKYSWESFSQKFFEIINKLK